MCNKNKESNRIDFLDISKGIGITLVVMGHLIGEGSKSFSGSDFFQGWIYSFHMPLFFIISGILLGFSLSKDAPNKYKKKATSLLNNLLLPYFLWTAVYFVLDSRSLNSYSYLNEWLICTLSFRGRAPIWFAGALFWAEIIALLIVQFLEKNGYCNRCIAIKEKFPIRNCETKKRHFIQQKCLLLITVATFSLSAITWFFYNHNAPKSYIIDCFEVSVFRGILCLGFVLVGLLLHKTSVLNSDIKKAFPTFVTMMAASLFFCYQFDSGSNLHTFSIGNIFLFIASGVTGSIAVLELSKLACMRFNLKVLKVIGKNTLGIMCLHYIHLPFMQYATEICTFFKMTGLVAFLFSLVFVISCSLAGSFVLKRRLLL